MNSIAGRVESLLVRTTKQGKTYLDMRILTDDGSQVKALAYDGNAEAINRTCKIGDKVEFAGRLEASDRWGDSFKITGIIGDLSSKIIEQSASITTSIKSKKQRDHWENHVNKTNKLELLKRFLDDHIDDPKWCPIVEQKNTFEHNTDTYAQHVFYLERRDFVVEVGKIKIGKSVYPRFLNRNSDLAHMIKNSQVSGDLHA